MHRVEVFGGNKLRNINVLRWDVKVITFLPLCFYYRNHLAAVIGQEQCTASIVLDYYSNLRAAEAAEGGGAPR